MVRYCVGLLSVVAMLGIGGCASEGERVPIDVEAVMTHDFNGTDLQLVGKQAVAKLLAKNPFPPGAKAAVIVTKVNNLTDEHIEPGMVRQYILSELDDSNKVRLVSASATGEPAGDIMKQLEFQQSAFVDPTTAKKIGKLIGADFVLQGDISNLSVKAGGRKGQYFLFLLTLGNIETGEIHTSKVEIQKVSKSGLFGW